MSENKQSDQNNPHPNLQQEVNNDEIEPEVDVQHYFEEVQSSDRNEDMDIQQQHQLEPRNLPAQEEGYYFTIDNNHIHRPKSLAKYSGTIYNDQSKTKWKLENIKQIDEWNEFFQTLKIVHVQNLQIMSNEWSNIAKTICHIQFTKLKELSLYNNKIYSIEPLSKCDLSHVQNLRLDNNHIVHLTSLRKFKLKSLQQLDIQNNGFSEAQSLVQLDAKSFTVLRLEDWTEICSKNDNKNWIVKLNSTALNYIRCPNPKRLRQSEMDKMLIAKYSRLNIMRCNRNN